MKTYNAKIRWFDSVAGEGLVRLDDGRSIHLHWAAIFDRRECKHIVPTAKLDKLVYKNRPCTVRLYEDSHFITVNNIVEWK